MTDEEVKQREERIERIAEEIYIARASTMSYGGFRMPDMGETIRLSYYMARQFVERSTK